MGVRGYKTKQAGFAVVEGLLLLVLVAGIVGVAAFVVHQKNSADKTLTSSTSSQGKAPIGTTASIDQIAQQDSKTESSVDNSADSSYQQDTTSANGSLSALGGAYNEASY